jgi:hypothetical protein
MQLRASARDSAFPGYCCITAADVRPRRALPVTLGVGRALRERRLSFGRCVLELLTDTGAGSARTDKEHAGCDKC